MHLTHLQIAQDGMRGITVCQTLSLSNPLVDLEKTKDPQSLTLPPDQIPTE